MGYRRSVSQLTGFTRCSEAFRLQRFVKDLPVRPAAWLAVGSAMHTAYEFWENMGRVGKLVDIFYTDYNVEIEALKRKQPDLAWWMKRPNVKTVEKDIELYRGIGVQQAEAYQVHCLNSKWRVLRDDDDNPMIEVPFSIDLGGVEVIGKIDSIIEWPDGRLSIRDLKTGNKGDVSDDRQLGVYREAARQQLGIDLIWGEYWFLKDGTGRPVDLRRYTTTYLTDLFKAVDQAINEKLFLPNPGKHCQLCDRRPWCREKGLEDVEDDG